MAPQCAVLCLSCLSLLHMYLLPPWNYRTCSNFCLSTGNMVHYSPYDPHGGVHAGPLVTDNGFWDTFRTVYPMLSLIYPDHLGTIVQGELIHNTRGGFQIGFVLLQCPWVTFSQFQRSDQILTNPISSHRLAECIPRRWMVALLG